jgi:protein TonB
MFTNLIESQSHKQDLKRRGSFVVFTMAAYAVFFVFAGVLSIYAYDAQLEAQDQGLEVLSFVPPVVNPEVPVHTPPSATRSGGNNNGPARPTRLPVLLDNPSNPLKTPQEISTAAEPIPPARRGDRVDKSGVFDPGSSGPGPIGTNNGGGGGTRLVPDIGEPPPAKAPEAPAKPRTVHKQVINGLAVELPKPPYPNAAKQIRLQGIVNVQVLLDEAGKVVSAHAVSGSPLLSPAAVNAAYRARFTPTLLGGQPVKVSGVITYNFKLE